MFSTNDGRSWATVDCGQKVHLIDHGSRLINLKYHRGNSSLVLALVRKGCSGEFECVVHNKLLLSEDGGASFRSIRSFVYNFDWLKHSEYSRTYGSNGIVVTEQDNSTPRSPVFVHQTVGTPKNPDGISVYFSWDFFKAQTRIVQGGYKFWLSKCCLFVENADKKGRRVIYGTEVWENAFNWRPISFEDASIHEFFDLDIIKGLDSFTVGAD